MYNAILPTHFHLLKEIKNDWVFLSTFFIYFYVVMVTYRKKVKILLRFYR